MEAPESSPAPAPARSCTVDFDKSIEKTMNHEFKALDERLEKAMSQLHLSTFNLRNPLPATTTTTTQSRSETTSSVCGGPKAANFAVCCNHCDRTIPDSHYHCSTCDDGDYDLCSDCVDRGVTCYNAEHWLIKRFVRGDHILVSTTERIAPKPKAKEVEREPVQMPPFPGSVPFAIPPAFTRTPVRTCNSCVQELPDKEFLHCTTCEDFDLCKTCFVEDKHGHHPKHGFAPAVEGTHLPSDISKRLAPGRNQRHHAICDGCDKFVFGVRHKCLDCPDWDYCADCVVNAGFIHPNHRFVPIYEQFVDARTRNANRPSHYGICCDGPLCNGTRKSYIVGDRYKCTVCHDTDFCANCEASPANTHNRTHPLIKFKTPVRRVEVTTKGEDENGQRMPVMGDRLARKPVGSQAAATTVNPTKTSLHTVVDMKPEPEKAPVATPPQEEKSSLMRAFRQQQQQYRQSAALAKSKETAHTTQTPTTEPTNLVAVFERDTIADGTVMPPNHVFEQTWVLRNAGDVAWPAGCSIKYVGGDYMGHIDSSHPAGIHDLVSASESTVCYDSLAPGQEFPFTVLLRTPAREGKVISWWRLTTKDGHKFGHRLWCDVTVQASKVIEESKKENSDEEEEKKPLVEKTEAVSQSSSEMIFPTLEKESPETSIHEDVKSETAYTVEEETEGFEDCGEDDEWAEESDEGFLTDEEYDILDASDEEYLDDQHKKSQK